MLPKGTFSKTGATVGALLGGPKGAMLGSLAGRGIAAITGRGDYEVTNNSLSTIATSVDELPQFVKNKHTVVITHREYVADVLVPSVPAAYDNNTYVLNPGNGVLFPWLAQMAKQYQQYKIRGMVVEYKSNTSDYASSGPLGIVGIASNYNVNEVKFPNLVAFENSEYAVVTKPSRSMIHAIECAPRTGRDDFLFVRDPASIDVTAGNDNRFYDYALVQVATSGLPGTPGTLLGQLFVSYEIEFTKPVISPQAVVPVLSAGNVLISNANGALGITSGSRGTRITYASANLTPAAATVYDYVDLSSVTIFGDSGLDGTVITNRTATTMRLNRPGTYQLYWVITADTTATKYVFNRATGTDTAGSVAYAGSATGTGLENTSGNQMPCYCLNIVATNGYSGCVSSRIRVTNADSTNYVTVTMPRLTSHSPLADVVTTVKRYLYVDWVEDEAAQVVA